MQHLIEALAHEGILVIEPDNAPPMDQFGATVSLAHHPADPLGWLASFANSTHLEIDCPFLRLPAAVVSANAKQFWAILEALQPSSRLEKYVKAGNQKLRTLSQNASNMTFAFVHLRIENDWLGHCNRWGHLAVGDVCRTCQRSCGRSAPALVCCLCMLDSKLSTKLVHA